MPGMSTSPGAAWGAVYRVSTMPSPSIMAWTSRRRHQSGSMQVTARCWLCLCQVCCTVGLDAHQQNAACQSRSRGRGRARPERQEASCQSTCTDGVPRILLHSRQTILHIKDMGGAYKARSCSRLTLCRMATRLHSKLE